jgi:hypothetical protein
MTPVAFVATLSVSAKDGASVLDPVDPNAPPVSTPSAATPGSSVASPSTPAQDGAPALAPVPMTPVSLVSTPSAKDGTPSSKSTDTEVVGMGEALGAGPSEPVATHPRFSALIKVAGRDNLQHLLVNGQRLVVGSAPTHECDHLVIEGDAHIDPNHVALDLKIFHAQDKSIGVKVTDLKSTGGFFYKNKRIDSGKWQMTFCGESVRIGNHVLYVCRPDEDPTQALKSTDAKVVDTGEELVAAPSELVASRPRFVVIMVVQGVKAGEERWLIEGANERLVVGSAPTGEGDHWIIEGDERIDPNHVALDFKIFHSEGENLGVGVKVTDLEAAYGVALNRKRIASGKWEDARSGDTICIGNHVLKVFTSTRHLPM